MQSQLAFAVNVVVFNREIVMSFGPSLPVAPPLAADGSQIALGAAGAVFGFILLIVLIAFFAYGSLWLRAWLSRARVPLFTIVGMRLRKVSPNVIIEARINLTKAGQDGDAEKLESHYLAGGNVVKIARALIAADKANLELPWERACAIDLAGRDILDAVRTSVNPRVIDCPGTQSAQRTIDGIAKDGIQLNVRARVTVRACLERLVGGATEETIVARVGEGIVSAIGSAESYKDVLEKPEAISRLVLEKGLDAGTAFDILSIDVADVSVGSNIGAKLQADQAEADKQIAQAKAEERRAMAAAREKEMDALTQENRAKVVLAEAEIPKAMAQAFREGNLGIMDYYFLKNVQADTGMRNSIGGIEDQGGGQGESSA